MASGSGRTERTDDELGAFAGLLGLLKPLAVARRIEVLIRVCRRHVGSFSERRGLGVSKVWVGQVCSRVELRRSVGAGLAVNGLGSRE